MARARTYAGGWVLQSCSGVGVQGSGFSASEFEVWREGTWYVTFGAIADYWNGGVVIECNLNSCTEPLVWLNDLHVFDPVNNTWTDLSSSVSGTPPPANYGTRSVGMAALEGRLFVLGGGKRVGLANPAPVDSVRGETMFRLICHVVESGDNKCSCQDKGERFHVVRLRL